VATAEPQAQSTPSPPRSCLKRPRNPTFAETPGQDRIPKAIKFSTETTVHEFPVAEGSRLRPLGKTKYSSVRRRTGKRYPTRSADIAHARVDASCEASKHLRNQQAVRQYWLRIEQDDAQRRVIAKVPKQLMAVAARQETAEARLQTALRAADFMSIISRELARDLKRDRLKARGGARRSGQKLVSN
jgi:hypothetical protein